MKNEVRKRPGRRIEQAFVLNIVGAVLIAVVFAVITVTALVSADDELAETSLQTAQTWVNAALVDRPAMTRVMAGQDIDEADLLYLRTAALGGGITYFSIHGPDGTMRLNATLADTTADFEEDRRPHPIMPDWEIPPVVFQGTPTLKLTEEKRDDEAVVVASAFVPVMEGGTLVGVAGVILDQTQAAEIYAEEARGSILFSAIMATLALLTSAATGYLILAQRRSERTIRFMAHHDPLTGVANRNLFNSALSAAIAETGRDGSTLALHLIDLDKFKAVNDTLGHDAGDALLRDVCSRIGRHIRAGDLLARLGGDEFAVIQKGVTNPRQVQTLAERMLSAVTGIDRVDEVPMGVSASIGIAMVPEHASDIADLQKCADVALYRAKENGRAQAAVYQPGMDDELRVRNMLRQLLRHSADAGTFELNYQPIHDTRTGALAGFEALLRLPATGEKPIAPSVFIPIAEDMGLTPRIGAWVLKEACNAAAGWPRDLTVSVNLSAQQFESDIVGDVRAALAGSGLEGSRLELEITESLFIREPGPFLEKLHQLKALGTRIVMDDFGTGYSSLNYLWMFPFDKVKVDRTCFLALDENDKVAHVLRTIAALGSAMNLRLTAEGVETEAQHDFALQAGYDEIQGFLFSRPMDEGAVAGYIAASTRPGGAAAREVARVDATRAGAGAGAAAAGVAEMSQPPGDPSPTPMRTPRAV